MSQVTTLRSAIVSRLAAANLVPAGRVWEQSPDAVPAAQRPALTVYTTTTSRQRISIGAPRFRCQGTVLVICWGAGATTEQNPGGSGALGTAAAEALAENVINTLLLDPSFLAGFEWVDGIDQETDVDDSSPITARVVLSFRAQWTERRTLLESSPHVTSFEGVNAELDASALSAEGSWDPEQPEEPEE